MAVVLNVAAHFTTHGIAGPDGTGSVNVDVLAILFPQDTNRDGAITPTELGGSVNVIARLTVPTGVTVGQTWTVDSGEFGVVTGVVTPTDLTVGYIDVPVRVAPVPPNPPTIDEVPIPDIVYTADLNGDGLVGDDEYPSETQATAITVLIPPALDIANDSITYSIVKDGVSTAPITVTLAALTGRITDGVLTLYTTGQLPISNGSEISVAVNFVMGGTPGHVSTKTLSVHALTIEERTANPSLDLNQPTYILPIVVNVHPESLGATAIFNYSYTVGSFDPDNLSYQDVVQTVVNGQLTAVISAGDIAAGKHEFALTVPRNYSPFNATVTVLYASQLQQTLSYDTTLLPTIPMQPMSVELLNDTDHDGILTLSEYTRTARGRFTFGSDTLVGDLLFYASMYVYGQTGSYANSVNNVLITADMLTVGYVDVDLTLPAQSLSDAIGTPEATTSGAVSLSAVTMRATYVGYTWDATGGGGVTLGADFNYPPIATTALRLLTDADGDGHTSPLEWSASTALRVQLRPSAAVGDIVTWKVLPLFNTAFVSTGSELTVNADMVTAGFVDIPFTLLPPKTGGDPYTATLYVGYSDALSIAATGDGAGSRTYAYLMRTDLTIDNYAADTFIAPTLQIMAMGATTFTPQSYVFSGPVNVIGDGTGAIATGYAVKVPIANYIPSAGMGATVTLRAALDPAAVAGMALFLKSEMQTAGHQRKVLTSTDITNGYIDFAVTVTANRPYAFQAGYTIPSIIATPLYYGSLLTFFTAPDAVPVTPAIIPNLDGYTAHLNSNPYALIGSGVWPKQIGAQIVIPFDSSFADDHLRDDPRRTGASAIVNVDGTDASYDITLATTYSTVLPVNTVQGANTYNHLSTYTITAKQDWFPFGQEHIDSGTSSIAGVVYQQHNAFYFGSAIYGDTSAIRNDVPSFTSAAASWGATEVMYFGYSTSWFNAGDEITFISGYAETITDALGTRVVGVPGVTANTVFVPNSTDATNKAFTLTVNNPTTKPTTPNYYAMLDAIVRRAGVIIGVRTFAIARFA